MTIPSVPDLTLPLLQAMRDGQPHQVTELKEKVAESTGVTAADRKLFLPSGKVRTYDNRVGWALKELKVAGLVDNPERAIYRITPAGQELLRAPPGRLDRGFLVAHFAQAKAFYEALSPQSPSPVSEALGALPGTPRNEVPDVDPIEAIEAASSALREALSLDLAKRIQANSPAFFEELVIDLVVALGYGSSRASAAEHLGKSGDGGVDGVINEDRLGLSRLYLQAKRYSPEKSVDVDTVRAFSGSLDERRSEKGILIATCKFTKPARDFAARSLKHIRLIDGTELTQLMIEAGVGVSPEQTYVIKRVDSDYFGE